MIFSTGLAEEIEEDLNLRTLTRITGVIVLLHPSLILEAIKLLKNLAKRWGYHEHGGFLGVLHRLQRWVQALGCDSLSLYRQSNRTNNPSENCWQQLNSLVGVKKPVTMNLVGKLIFLLYLIMFKIKLSFIDVFSLYAFTQIMSHARVYAYA